MTRIAPALSLTFVLAVALATASCATAAPDDVPAPADGTLRIEGTITAIDLQPWTYDGNATVQVDADGRGEVQVQLPARWNLCKAPPVDVQSLAVGMRVQAVGVASGGGGLVVCEDAAHRLQPLQ